MLKVIGAICILCALLIAFLIPQTNHTQRFILYTLTGIGLALLMARSAGHSRLEFNARNVSVFLVGGMVLPFTLFFTDPISKFKQGNDFTTSVTVFVHGKRGRQDMILRQQGHVIMDVEGGERKRSDINENGAAFFQNLHINDKVQLEVDFSEPYKSLSPDSTYIIPSDNRLYLQVALQGIGIVYGKVLSEDDPLPGVIVQIHNLTDTTDENGNFNIAIPDKQQTKEYKVWFSKPGFKTISSPSFPQTGQALEIALEKQPE